MSLRMRLAVTLALLAAGTAALVAVVGYQVTSSRLDREVDDALTIALDRLRRADPRVLRQCGFSPEPGFAPRPRRAPGPDAGPPFPGLVGLELQCLDESGNTLASSPSARLPVDDRDRELAESSGAGFWHFRNDDVDGEAHRILTVGVRGIGAIQVARSLAENERVLDSLLRRFLAITAGATCGAIIIALLLSRRIARPIAQLTAAAEDITGTGVIDPDQHTVLTGLVGTHETGRLARSFRTMLEALNASRQQQQSLVQDAGHELRTPLTSLRANVALLQRNDLPAPARARALQDLHLELEELTDLTNELVALAGGATDDEPASAADLSEITKEAVGRCSRRTGRAIVVTASAAMFCDIRPRAVGRAIDNVLSNAVKFSPAETAIDVSTEVVGDRAVLTVRDHGPGFAAADLPRVFERFYRADTARSSPGSGLGLSIVRDIVLADHGTVEASNHPDGGAVLVLSFPAARL